MGGCMGGDVWGVMYGGDVWGVMYGGDEWGVMLPVFYCMFFYIICQFRSEWLHLNLIFNI